MQPTKHRDPRGRAIVHAQAPTKTLPPAIQPSAVPGEREPGYFYPLSPGLTCGSSPYLPPPLPPDPDPPEPILPPEPMLPEPDIPLECDWPPLVSRSEWDPDSN